MADIDVVLSLCPGTKKINLHASYAIFDEENPWVDRDKLEPKHFPQVGGFLQGARAGCGLQSDLLLPPHVRPADALQPERGDPPLLD